MHCGEIAGVGYTMRYQARDWVPNGKPFRANLGLPREFPYVKGTRCVKEVGNGTIMTGPRGGRYYYGSRGSKVYCSSLPKFATPAPATATATGSNYATPVTVASPPRVQDAPKRPTDKPTGFKKGTVKNGYIVDTRKKGSGKIKYWRKL